MSEPNNRALMVVENRSGAAIHDVSLQHTYDEDLSDGGWWPLIADGKSSDFYDGNKGARYWTGAWWLGNVRPGDDYWYLSFVSAGYHWGQPSDDAKKEFTLHSADNGKTVVFEIGEGQTEGGGDGGSYHTAENKVVRLKIDGVEKASFKVYKGEPATHIEERPVYIIAHHCNELKEVGESLGFGANGIEFDVCYGLHKKQGLGWYVRHENFDEDIEDALGIKVHVFGDGIKLDEWLQEAARCLSYTQFALLIVDIKTPLKAHLPALHQAVSQAFPSQTGLNVIFSTADYKDRECFDDIIGSLTTHQGLAIDYHNDPQEVQKYFKEKNVTRFWYGNGINELVSFTDNIKHSLIEATKQRDTGEGILKVYTWTFKDVSKAVAYMHGYFNQHTGGSRAIDGVMITQGQHLEVARDRLTFSMPYARPARREDNAFEAFSPVKKR